MKRAGKLALAAAALALMAGVFALYGRPDFFMTVANQIWGCF